MRAQRFPLVLPVRHRLAGTTRWGLGCTVNLSSTGALLCVENLPPRGLEIELRIVLPSRTKSAQPEIHAIGTIVRRILPTPTNESFGVAVTIDSYQVVPSSRPFAASSGSVRDESAPVSHPPT